MLYVHGIYTDLTLMTMTRTSLLSPPLATGLLRPPLSICPLFCTSVFRGRAHACRPTAEIRLVVYLRKFDVHGILWNSQGTCRALEEHVPGGQTLFYLSVFRVHVRNLVCYLFLWRRVGIPPRHFGLGGAVA
jgi:hypothetical protein